MKIQLDPQCFKNVVKRKQLVLHNCAVGSLSSFVKGMRNHLNSKKITTMVVFGHRTTRNKYGVHMNARNSVTSGTSKNRIYHVDLLSDLAINSRYYVQELIEHERGINIRGKKK